jgi:hypothetical protein
MNFKLLLKNITFLFLFIYSNNYGQCAYIGTPLTKKGATYTFTVDNSFPISTSSYTGVRSGQYVMVNVVQGFNYTFSVDNAFSGGGNSEYLTLLDATTDASLGAGTYSNGNAGTSITWTATMSGSIKVLLSKNCVNDNSASGTITLTLNSIGNTLDTNVVVPDDQWVGYVYNWLTTATSAPPGGFPSPVTPDPITANQPFIPSNYMGYYTIATPDIANQTFTGNDVNFPVKSNELSLVNVFTAQFAVRYKSHSTKTGCYMATFSGDDGLRIYVDGVKIADFWKEQGTTSYPNLLLYLDGDSDIVFDYYENGGGNVASFSLTPFVPTTNTATAGSTVLCSNNTTTLNGSAYLTNGAVNPTISYQWQVSDDGTNFTDISGATNQDYTPAAITTSSIVEKYYRRKLGANASNASACVWYTNVLKITTSANMAVTAPTASAATYINCTGFTANWSSVSEATSYKLSVSTNSGFSSTVAGYNNLDVGLVTSYPVTGLTPGTTYYYRIRAFNSCGSTNSAYTSTITVAMAATAANTWNGSSWSILPAPTANQNITFAGNYSEVSDVVACSCTVTSGTVTIPTGKTLKLGGKLTVSGGSITFKNNASLLQTSFTAANTGAIIYERETTINRNTDFTYWSSPVVGQTLYNTSPLTLASQYFSYNATTNNWDKETATTKVMTPGIGYIIRGSETHKSPNPPATDIAVFNGVPNNGNITVPIVFLDPVVGTSNLIGNPYPSAISADKFLAANSAFIDGTLYFWTHNTAIQLASNIAATAGSGSYAYTSDDYASYNGVGGISAIKAISGVSGTNNSNIPNGRIAAGQSFFATGMSAGSVTFTNAMRIDNSGNTLDNAQFFKTSATKSKTTNTIEKNRIWLDLTNSQGAFKQTLVGYVTDATNEYDGRFDGESFDGNEFIDFYSVNQDKNLVIQGRALPFDETDEVPLGYRSTIDGDFTINIDQADGLLANQAVFIEDKLTNTTFDLKSGDYTFTTTPGTFNERFVLKYANKTLANTDLEILENQVLVSNKNKQIKITAAVETIDKVVVYDVLGRQIYQKNNINSKEFSILNLVASQQVLVVKTLLKNGVTITKKIVY